MRKTLATAMMSMLAIHASASGQEKERPLKVFVLAGTSNMLGAPAKIENLPEELRQPLKDVLIHKGDWVPLEAGKTLVGNEATFGLAMSKHLGEPIGIWWVSAASTSQKSPVGAVATYVRQAQDKGRPVVVVGMLADVSYFDGGKDETAKAYGENLVRWVEETRGLLGNAELPIVMNRAIPPGQNRPLLELVRNAQDAAKLPKFRVFDCDDVQRGADKIHFNTAGRLEIGKRFAAAMIELMKKDK
jgi:hypothetical protein